MVGEYCSTAIEIFELAVCYCDIVEDLISYWYSWVLK
jgi:hypothetical protein